MPWYGSNGLAAATGVTVLDITGEANCFRKGTGVNGEWAAAQLVLQLLYVG